VVLSKRERLIAITMLLAVGLFLLDRVVLTPLQDRKEAMARERDQALSDLERARALFDRSKQLAPRWKQAREAGLQSDVAASESAALHAVRNWAQESGLTLSSLRPVRSTSPQTGALREIILQTSGTGPMRAVVGFLTRLETSSAPMRVADLQLGTRKEGYDDLTLQLRISALCDAATSDSRDGATHE